MTVLASRVGVTVFDIPFLIRGRVVEPGEDSVEFGGRVGARFRTPDARAYADQLVLADAGALRDLAETPMDEIIDFLAELGPRLALERNPLMQAAFDMALEAGELTEPIFARGLWPVSSPVRPAPAGAAGREDSRQGVPGRLGRARSTGPVDYEGAGGRHS